MRTRSSAARLAARFLAVRFLGVAFAAHGSYLPIFFFYARGSEKVLINPESALDAKRKKDI